MRFRAKRAKILVCTDVAARGIDVKNITHVFNFGLPRNPESYVHRIGRTGRAGTKGTAVSFITPSQTFQIKRVERLTKSEIKPLKLPSPNIIKVKMIENELDRMQSLKDLILVKGEEFKVDETFGVFKDFMKDMDEEKSLMFMFTMKFNKDFQQLNQLGDIESQARAKSGRGDRPSGGRGRGGAGGGRSGRPRRPGSGGGDRRGRSASGGGSRSEGSSSSSRRPRGRR